MLPQAKTMIPLCDNQVTAGETATASFSRQDYDYAMIDVFLLGEETTDPPTVITLSEADGTTYANISGAVGGTDFTIPTEIATVGDARHTIVSFGVDLRARAKNIKLSVAAATKTQVIETVKLFRGDTAPNTTTLAGNDLIVNL